MRTKKKLEPDTERKLREVFENPEESGAVNEPSKRERFQMGFDLDEDGMPDFSSMRDKTKERLRTFFYNPKSAFVLGAKDPTPAAAEVQIFHPSMVAGMYAMVGALESMAVQHFGNVPESIAKQVFTYTSAEVEALTGPTVRVLNKYAADWMIKYQDELALATMLLAMTVAKVNVAVALAKMQKAGGQPVPAPTKPVEVNAEGPVQ